MEQAVKDFIQCKRIAVVGVSRCGKKFGNMIFTDLKKSGYETFAVNPGAQEIEGEPCYPNLAALKDKVDAVIISVPAAKTAQVVRDAADNGIRNVWIQQGAGSVEASALGKELGLNLIENKCIMMYAEPVKSFHGFHRFVAKLIGQY